MPIGVTVNKFSLDGTNLEITGTLDSMATLPSLVQNLRMTGLFVDVSTMSAALYQNKNGANTEADRDAEVNSQANEESFSDPDSLITENADSPSAPDEPNQQAIDGLLDDTPPHAKEGSESSSDLIVYSISCWLKGDALT
jgi:hypothetical protein